MFLLLPPLYVLFIVSLIFSPATLSKIFPGPVLWMGLASFIIGNALMIYVSMMGVFKRGRYRHGGLGARQPALLAAALASRRTRRSGS